MILRGTVVPLVLALLAACGGGESCPRNSIGSGSAGNAVEAPAGPPAEASPVTRVVFVDLEKACACTQERIDASWAAMVEALDGRSVDVDRIHGDTQEQQAQPYLDMKPVMVAPALYFLDAQGRLVQQLQGEVTAAAIREALG